MESKDRSCFYEVPDTEIGMLSAQYKRANNPIFKHQRIKIILQLMPDAIEMFRITKREIKIKINIDNVVIKSSMVIKLTT